MNLRRRFRRTAIAFLATGFVLSTIQVDDGARIPAALADTTTIPALASPVPPGAPAASPSPDPSDAPDDPTKGPRGGDLTHLTFTATDGLTAALNDPVDDGVAGSTAAAIAVQTVRGAGVELKVGGEVIPFSRIGKRTVDTKTGQTIYTYYGVVLRAGANDVQLTPLGANGLRGTTSTHRIYGPGRPVAIAIAASGPLRADGSSVDDLRIQARDAWGHHAASGELVQLTLVSGDARLSRVAVATDDPAAPAVTPTPQPSPSPGAGAANTRQTIGVALGPDGSAIVHLLPGMIPGDIVLQASSGDATCETRVFLAPNPRKPFVNGLVTAGAGAVPGIPDSPDDVADGTNSRRGRIAVFGTGSVGSGVLTFAYDTANVLQRTTDYSGAASVDPSDRPYAITGDTSSLRDDALSRDHLFFRYDSGRTSAEWGEFQASTTTDPTNLGAFNQLVDGAKLDVAGANARATVFAARNDVGYDRRVFAPTGLASGVMLYPQIVVGSDVAYLAAIDRRTGAVLTQTPLTNGVDYTIEYSTGQLRFINIPLPFDQNFNPQEVVLTYEYDDPSGAAKTVGGHAEVALGKAVKLGLGYVNDTTGAGNVTLASQSLSGTIPGGSWSIVHATSAGSLLATSADQTQAGDGGGALHAALTRSVGNDHLSLLFDQTGAGYDDPFGGLSTPGLINEAVSYGHKFAGGQGEIDLDLDHQANVGINGAASTTQTEAQLRARRQLGKRVTVTASVDRRVSTSSAVGTQLAVPTPAPSGTPSPYDVTNLPAQESTQVQAGVDWRVTNAATLSVDRLQTIGGENSVQPTQTDAQLTYDIGKIGRVYARERWSAAPVESFADATQALTSGTGGTRSFEVGVENRLGPMTTVDDSWGVDHTANGSSIYTALGVQEKLNLGRVKGNAFIQDGTASGYDSSSGGFDVYGLSLSYADPSNRLRVSGSSQLRTGNGAGFSDTLGAAGALTQDLSVFAALTDARSDGNGESDDKVGLAWRPAQSDDGVTLFQYERQTGTGTYDGNDEGAVLSLEQVVRLRRRTEVTARYAYKLDGDQFYEAHSSLLGLRVDQTLGDRYDVGAEIRRANVLGIDGATSNAFALEAGLRLGNQTRFGVGYNFSATADPSLATTPQHRGFYTTVTTVVDRILGWGR
ncbi:MAG TPA: hypothetical protein VMD91_02885 [Candidatus Sulfotelmatobacter sp.]|nr:hypothetical protein [Candidatus Sulfotelmatobacter sp.]